MPRNLRETNQKVMCDGMNDPAPDNMRRRRQNGGRCRSIVPVLVGMCLLAGFCCQAMAQEQIPAPGSGNSDMAEAGRVSELTLRTATRSGDEVLSDWCQRMAEDSPSTMLTVDIRPRNREGELVAADRHPEDCAKYVIPDVPEFFDGLTRVSCGCPYGYCWEAARFCHRPLYFEEFYLERCGVTRGCYQPLFSGLHFFGSAALLPIRMWHTRPCSCMRTPACY